MGARRESPIVNVIETAAELESLREPWSDLLAEDRPRTPFLTWEWMSTWWRHFGGDRRLWILAARDRHGDLIGLAPWMLSTRGAGPWKIRRISFIGDGDHADILARPEERDAVIASFLRFLDDRRPEWDVLDLERVKQGSDLIAHLAASGPLYAAPCVVPCPLVPLPEDWPSFEARVLSQKMQKKLRYAARRLDREHPGEMTLRRIEDPAEIGSALETLASLSRKRWDRRTCFGTPGFIAFHREIAALSLARGWLRFFVLELRGIPVAATYCFAYDGEYHAYQLCIDREWAALNVGHLLVQHVIEEAIREGASAFDYLRGAERYKRDWASAIRADVRVLYGLNGKVHIAWALAALGFAAKTIGKSILGRWRGRRGRAREEAEGQAQAQPQPQSERSPSPARSRKHARPIRSQALPSP